MLELGVGVVNAQTDIKIYICRIPMVGYNHFDRNRPKIFRLGS